MARTAETRPLRIWGPLSAVGAGFAVLTFAVDQAHKWFMLTAYGIVQKSPVNVLPGFDLVMVWNYGISYGWFASHSQATRWLLIAFSLAASAALWLWLARQRAALPAAAIGLVLGGALANALDRVIHGAVADFFHFYWGKFSWYVFNLADVAIVVGVALLMYDSLRTGKTRQTG